MTHLHKAARWAGVAAVSAMLLSGGPAYAEAFEYFKCKTNEGVENSAMVALGKDFVALAHKNGHDGFSVAFLYPVFAADISRGTFYWQGTAPNLAGIGAINDFWEGSDENADIRKRWREMTADCEASSMYMVERAE